MQVAVDEHRHMLANRTLVVQDVVAQPFTGLASRIERLRERASRQLLRGDTFVTLDRRGKIDGDHTLQLKANHLIGQQPRMPGAAASRSSVPCEQRGVAARCCCVDRHGLLGDEAIQIVRATGLGARA